MPPQEVTTRFAVQFIWHATTSELSGAGGQKNLALAVNPATGTDYDTMGQMSDTIATLSTMFNRWRCHSVTASWCGAVSSTNTETSGIKYVPETLPSKAAGDWYDFTEGHAIAFHLPYQTTVSKLHLSRSTLARAGLPWLECSNSSDNTGCAGTLCFFTSFSTAEAIRIHIVVDLEFAGLADTELNGFARTRAGGPGRLSLEHVLSLGKLASRRPSRRAVRDQTSPDDGDGFQDVPCETPVNTPRPSAAPSGEGGRGGAGLVPTVHSAPAPVGTPRLVRR